jgi:hypothetical protein
MSLGSPAEIIPFKRVLDCGPRLHRIGRERHIVMPASTAVGLRPEVTGTANDDDGPS